MRMSTLQVAAVLAATLAAPGAFASDPAPQATEAMRVVRDKETGQLRAPTAEERQALLQAEQAARAKRGAAKIATTQPATVRTYRSGMKALVVGPDHLVMLEAGRAADGQLEVRHAQPGYEQQPALDRPTE